MTTGTEETKAALEETSIAPEAINAAPEEVNAAPEAPEAPKATFAVQDLKPKTEVHGKVTRIETVRRICRYWRWAGWITAHLAIKHRAR